MYSQLYEKAVALLKELISTPSHSREEENSASILYSFLQQNGVEEPHRLHNNVWAYNKYYSKSKPTILLNSHHDTVKPNPAYSRNPYLASEESGTLYGLGSNDAGGSVVSLLALFLYFYSEKDLKYNLCIVISGEEEVSGKNGIESVLPHIPEVEFALVGEPTGMNMAIAERGLMVLDCIAEGKAGHAAREEGDNAIYKAIKDIEWFKGHKFKESSQMLGSTKMSVTIIEAGTQHNVVPAQCKFTVDVRTADCHTNEQLLEFIRSNVSSTVTPRSVRLRPSSISANHPIVKRGIELGRTTFGSPTMSDQALIPYPSLKMGVGESERSHAADEFIKLKEIEEGIEIYISLFDTILK